MTKEKLQCWTKKRSDGQDFTTCLQGQAWYKSAQKLKIETIVTGKH